MKLGKGTREVVGPGLIFAVSENSLRELPRRLRGVRKILVDGAMHIDQEPSDNCGLLTSSEFKKPVGDVPAQKNSDSK